MMNCKNLFCKVLFLTFTFACSPEGGIEEQAAEFVKYDLILGRKILDYQDGVFADSEELKLLWEKEVYSVDSLLCVSKSPYDENYEHIKNDSKKYEKAKLYLGDFKKKQKIEINRKLLFKNDQIETKKEFESNSVLLLVRHHISAEDEKMVEISAIYDKEPSNYSSFKFNIFFTKGQISHWEISEEWVMIVDGKIDCW